MRILSSVSLAAVFAAVLFGSYAARACDDRTVRDQAFSEPRDTHRLCVIADSGDPDADRTMSDLSDWLVTSASGMNLGLVRVEADDPEVKWEEEVGIPSAPPSMPVVVLVGNDVTARRAFYIRHWEPAPTAEDLAALTDSKLRKTLRPMMGPNMAVLLHAPGSEQVTEGTPSAQLLNLIAKEWTDRETLPTKVLKIDRTDETEALLLSFLGVEPEGPDWVGVMFGKGKITPPIRGAEINRFALDERLASLAAECTCLSTASKLGVDLPMLWSGADDATKIPLRLPLEEMDPIAASAVGEVPMRTTLWAVALVFGVALIGGGVALRRRGELA